MFLNNLRCACRNLRGAPGFTLTAILSLGFGIGATLAMFTVVRSILIKPLSFRDPGPARLHYPKRVLAEPI